MWLAAQAFIEMVGDSVNGSPVLHEFKVSLVTSPIWFAMFPAVIQAGKVDAANLQQFLQFICICEYSVQHTVIEGNHLNCSRYVPLPC